MVYSIIFLFEGRLIRGEQYPFSNIMKYMLLCVYKLDAKEISLNAFDAKKKIADSKKYSCKREIDTESFVI
jgi:hypothetical protein